VSGVKCRSVRAGRDGLRPVAVGETGAGAVEVGRHYAARHPVNRRPAWSGMRRSTTGWSAGSTWWQTSATHRVQYIP